MAKTPTTKKSATTELVLGQAAQNISKAVSELKTATESVNKLGTLGEELTLLVANKEEAIAALEVQYAEKARQADVDLELSMKANTERVVTSYLNETGKVAIAKNELTALTKELADTKANAEAETKKHVAQVAGTLKAQYENDIRFIQSENKATAAENASKIGTLAQTNKFLEEQVTKLYLQLDAERAAGIERAKAGSVGSINVGSDNRK
jgi:hypothetical protein